MGRRDKPLSEQRPSRREIRQALADAATTPVGTVGISTADAVAAVLRGKERQR